jgi:RecA-family ATPase
MSVVFKKFKSGNVIGLVSKELVSAITEYQELGFHVLPLDSDNVCHKNKEQQEVYVIESVQKDFSGKGVGVHLEKSQLVGIDVDCYEAGLFLETFLPQTATTCRKSKPLSWMFFKLKGGIEKNISYRNCDSEGNQSYELGGIKFKAVTSLPPTIHAKSQETLEWKSKEPATITAKELIETSSRCFGLTLIAQRWPNAGNRHEAGLTLAGTLVHAGWNPEDAKKAVRTLAKATNDDKVEDRLNELKSTYQNHQKGNQVTGLSKLIEHLSDSPNEQAYLKKHLYVWLRGNPYLDKEPETPSFDLGEYIMSAKNYVSMPVPPQQYIVDNWLPVGGLISVFAARGVGKTWFALELALSVAKGKDFFDWPITKSRRVLYIDGEMSIPMLQKRIMDLSNGDIPDNLFILPVSLLRRERTTLNIHQTKTQKEINKHLDAFKEQGTQPDLIILDNLSALGRGIDDNNNSDQEKFLDWLLELRSLGYSVLTIDHEGKSSNQGSRGASRKEDFLDTVIRLKARNEDSKGANFEISFTKIRGEKPNPYRLAVQLTSDEEGKLKWDTDSIENMPAYLKIAMAIHKHNPKTQADIVKKTGFVKSHVSTQVKILAEKGLIEKEKLTLTAKGKASVDPYLQDESDMEDNL